MKEGKVRKIWNWINFGSKEAQPVAVAPDAFTEVHLSYETPKVKKQFSRIAT